MAERDAQLWAAVPPAGHTLGSLQAADSITLRIYDISRVGNMLANNDNAAGYNLQNLPVFQDLRGRFPQVYTKLDDLRKALNRPNRVRQMTNPLFDFSVIVQQSKPSRLYIKLRRGVLESGIPGPPAYFTRRNQGIIVPPLHIFMQASAQLFRFNLPAKTLEHSFLIMLSQIWTNQKQNLVETHRGVGEPVSPNCDLCDCLETTEHLLFYCPRYASLLWEHIDNIQCQVIQKLRLNSGHIHLFNIMYSVSTKTIAHQFFPALDLIIFETKRMIIKKRVQRLTTTRTNVTDQRVLQHLFICVQSLKTFMQYQGKCVVFITEFLELLQQLI